MPTFTCPPVHTELVTDDTDTAAEVLARQYGLMRLNTMEPGRVFRHSRWDAGSFCIDDVIAPVSMDVNASAPGYILASATRRGLYRSRGRGFDQRVGPGEVALACQPHLPYTAQTFDAAIDVVVIDPSLVEAVARDDPEVPLPPVRFDGLEPVSPTAAVLWRRTVAFVEHDILANPEAATSPLLVGQAGRMLAAVTLSTFRTMTLAEPVPGDRTDATSATLRRAMAAIQANAGNDVSMVDIAAEAHVTVRAVQLAFRRHLDTTPMAYLRQVRLERAHRDLVEADRAQGTTVTAIATRWGFPHPGRFAALYRAVYGVSPKVTLHSS